MAEDGGLFSGLKFTDIFFPAAATIASAYNPHIGRGLQTGMNLFNSFQDFQNSARYYKSLKEQKERERVGLESGQAGIDEYIAHLQGKAAKLPAMMPGDPRQEGPLLDENETSKFTMFGEDGPTLADPGKFSLHMREMTGIGNEEAEAGQPEQLELGIESMANPRFSEIDTEAIVANSENTLQGEAINDLIAQQTYMRSLMPGAFGVAAQGSSLGANQLTSDSFRDSARKKDLLAAFEQQDRAAELAELERQARLRQVQAEADIYGAKDLEKHQRSVAYAEEYMKGKGPEETLSYSEQQQAKARMYSAFQVFASPDASGDQKISAKQRVIELAMDYKNRGHEDLSPAVQELLDEYLAAQTGAFPMMPSHNRPTQTVNLSQAEAQDVDDFSATLFGQ